MSLIERFEKMLAAGQDTALLRFSLGTAYRKAGQPEKAAQQLRSAVEQQPDYSAAWKELGRALVDSGECDEAGEVYQRGIEVARAKGDKQAEKEMTVFLRRLQQ